MKKFLILLVAAIITRYIDKFYDWFFASNLLLQQIPFESTNRIWTGGVFMFIGICLFLSLVVTKISMDNKKEVLIALLKVVLCNLSFGFGYGLIFKI